MKIAVDIRHLAAPRPTGVGRYTLELLREAASSPFAPSLHLFASGSRATLAHLPDWLARRFSHTYVTMPNRLLAATLLARARTLESFLPESPNAWWFPNPNFIHTRLPYALTVHDVAAELFADFFKPKDRAWHKLINIKTLAQNARAILAVSETTKRDTVHVYGALEKNITVTHLGVRNAFHPNHEPADDQFLRALGITKPYFLTLATLEPRKNIESVIHAYELWNKVRPLGQTSRSDLVIAGGKGWQAKNIVNAKNIIWLKYVDEKHKPALMRHASAFIFPSFYEGFGLPVLEAMASGTPVIASHAGSLPEIVQNAGILIDPMNTRDIVQALTILEDQKTRETLAERTQIIAKNFSWDKTWGKTQTVLESLSDN